MEIIYRHKGKFYSSAGRVHVKSLHKNPITVECQRTRKDLERILDELKETRPYLESANAGYFVQHKDPLAQTIKVVSFPEGYPSCKELPTIKWQARFYQIMPNSSN